MCTADQTEIAKPHNFGVLRARGVLSLTLVTSPYCLFGNAPLRFVIDAVLKKQVGASSLRTVPNRNESKHFEDKEKGI